MALSLALTESNNFYGPSLSESYFKIMFVTNDYILIAMYLSKAAKDAGTLPVSTISIPNKIHEYNRYFIYEYLKTLPEFTGAVDV